MASCRSVLYVSHFNCLQYPFLLPSFFSHFVTTFRTAAIRAIFSLLCSPPYSTFHAVQDYIINCKQLGMALLFSFIRFFTHEVFFIYN